MKKIKCILLILLFASLVNAQGNGENFNLSISSDGKLILQQVQLINSDGYDKTVSEPQKEYVFNDAVNRYGQYSLSVIYFNPISKKKGSSNIQLFLKPGDSKLVFLGTSGKYNLTGASATMQKEFEKFVSTDQVLLKRVLMLDSRLHQYQKSGNRMAAMQMKDSLYQAERVRKNMLESYVRQHPNDDLSLYAMEVYSGFNRENPIEIKSLLSALGKELQETEAMQEIRKDAEENEKFMKGAKAPEFAQADTNGTPVTLSSLQGKYVLIDFWASWCKPCRAQNPSLVRLYQKYKDKGFTILGVSLDSKKESWLKAIYNDKLEWQHVSDLKFWSNAVAKQYKISSVPQNFLLDPKGIIIGKNFNEEDLDQLLEKELGKSN